MDKNHDKCGRNTLIQALKKTCETNEHLLSEKEVSKANKDETNSNLAGKPTILNWETHAKCA